MSASAEQPAMPSRLRRPLVAASISLGLHAAVIAWVQVAPPASPGPGLPEIEARLVSTHAAPSVAEALPPPVTALPDTPPEAAPQEAPQLAPSDAAESPPADDPPVAPPAAALPDPAPTAAAPLGGADSSPAAEPAPAAALTSAVDLTYYRARDLDVHPRALREIVPDYPDDADRRRLSGRVRLQLKVEADGRVSDIELVSASPPDVFNESALRAFRDARFAPAQRQGRPVRALVLVEVAYEWGGRP